MNCLSFVSRLLGGTSLGGIDFGHLRGNTRRYANGHILQQGWNKLIRQRRFSRLRSRRFWKMIPTRNQFIRLAAEVIDVKLLDEPLHRFIDVLDHALVRGRILNRGKLFLQRIFLLLQERLIMGVHLLREVVLKVRGQGVLLLFRFSHQCGCASRRLNSRLSAPGS